MHHTTIRHLAGAGVLCAAAVAAAQRVPTYSDFELQARTGSGFNLPFGSAFTNGTTDINNDGAVAFRLISVGTSGSAGTFTGEDGVGEVVYVLPNLRLSSDTSINNAGVIVFEQWDFGVTDGVFKYDPVTGATSNAVPPGGPFNSFGFESPQIDDAGRIAFRADIAGNHAYIVADGGVQTMYEAMVQIDPSSGISFLFAPSFNNQQQIAGKARLGAAGQLGNDQPDVIRIWESDGSFTTIAEDTDANAGSPYSSFDNSVALNDEGWVAFIASLVGGGRGVYLSDGVTTRTVATTNHPEVGDVEFFPPAVNNNGLVVFRARDAQNRYAIYVGDGATLERVVGQFDEVPTDLGLGQIARPDTFPVFGGGVRINDHGDVTFNASLASAANINTSWGSGAFIAYADVALPGDLNGDGVVNGADLAALLANWGPCAGCPADLNSDGVVNGADLATLLANWGASSSR